MNARRIALLAAAPTLFILGGTFALANPGEAGAETPGAEIQLAQRGEEGPGGRGPGMRGLQQLDLTQEQQEAIRSIFDAARTETEDQREALKAAKEQLKSLMSSGTATDAQLRQQHQEIQSLKQALGAARFETMLEVRQVLTPEQRSQLAELKEQRGQRGPRGRRSQNIQ